MLLHGEQYLAIKAPIPTTGTLVNEPKLMEVLDKGKAAAVTSITETKDKATGRVIFESQSTVFIRGSGGFGGKKTGKDRGPATAANKPPSRPADKVIEEKTEDRQAALYRLSGDYNVSGGRGEERRGENGLVWVETTLTRTPGILYCPFTTAPTPCSHSHFTSTQRSPLSEGSPSRSCTGCAASGSRASTSTRSTARSRTSRSASQALSSRARRW